MTAELSACVALIVVLVLLVAYLFSQREEGMMNTAHWDTDGTYGHTGATWGLPPLGGLQPDYSGYSKNSFDGRENMMVGAHWTQSGTYGHTAGTLPDFGLSGYNEEVPTDAN